MQELKTKEAVRVEEAAEKSVSVFLQSSFFELSGTWQWDLATDAFFCSDVMFSFPADFPGTKAIFHPDDLAIVKEALSANATVAGLEFRVITTYGEVKLLTGWNITVQNAGQPPVAMPDQTAKSAARDQEQKAAQQHYEILKEVAERSERLTSTGSWYYNSVSAKAWYSDFVFYLHGLAPQSLNAHLHTFQPFVHPEDAVLVAEFLDKAFAEKAPLHMEYRIQAGEKIKWVGYKSHWFYSAKGEPVMGGIYQDITEQKAAEKELDSYKAIVQFQRQQLLYDEQQVAFGHWQINLLTRKANYSDQYYRIFGLKPQSLPPNMATFLNYIHPDDRERMEALYRKMILEHEFSETEFQIVRADGKVRFVVQKAKLLAYEGELLLTGVLQDVTVQRMLEKRGIALQETIWKQSIVAQQGDETANLFSWIYDMQDQEFTWSESFLKLLNYQKIAAHRITEKTVFSLIHPHDVKVFQQHWTNAALRGEPASFDVRLMQRGVVSYMKAVFSRYTYNEKAFFVGTLQNNTAEHVLQQQLSQRVQLAETLTENIADRVMITDANHTILLWNAACEKAYGVRKNEVVGENFFDVFSHLKTEEEMSAFHRVLRGERVVQTEKFSQIGNGYYNIHLIPLYTAHDVTGILHVVHDVSGEMELRKSLADRLQLIESIVESSVDRIIALDRNLNYIYWNKKAAEYYGLAKEKVIGKNILEVFPQLVNDPSYGEIRRALRGETVFIPANLERKKYFETYLVPIKNDRGAVSSLLWVAHDRSAEMQLQAEQQKAQQELKNEHRRLKEAQAIGHVGSFEWTTSEKPIFWSDEMYRIHGLKPQSQTMTMEKVLLLIHPDDRERFMETVRHCRTAPMERSLTHRIVKPNGGIRTVTRRIQSFSNEEGTVTHLSGTLQDITEQEAAEEEIKAKQELLAATMDSSREMIQVFEAVRNERGEIVDFKWLLNNRTAQEHYGDVIGKSLLQQNPGVAEEGIFDAFRQVVETGIPQQYEKRYVHEQFNGWFHQSVVKLNDGVATTTTDITAQKTAEEQLRQQSHYLQRILETGPDMISIMELPSRKVHYLNEETFEAHGFGLKDMANKSREELLAIIHAEDRAALATYYGQLETATYDETVTAEYRAKNSHGHWKSFMVRGKVFQRNEEGVVTQILNVIEDITARKKAE